MGFLNSQSQWGDYRYEKLFKGRGLYINREIENVIPNKTIVGSDEYWIFEKKLAKEQIKVMIKNGIDGVIYDMLPMTKFNEKLFDPDKIETHPFENFKLFGIWLDAAKEVSSNFKICPMLDVMQKSAENPQGEIPSADKWIELITVLLKVYASHPNFFKIDEKPCLLHFGTTRPLGGRSEEVTGGWGYVINSLKRKNMKLYFVSDFRPKEEANLARWLSISDGLQVFAPGAPLGFGLNYQKGLAKDVEQAGKDYWWGISRGYYSKKWRVYLPPNFTRLNDLWMAAAHSAVKYAEVITWNDLFENTDIWPSLYNGDSLVKINKFYSYVFKHGKIPSDFTDTIVLAFPSHINKEILLHVPYWGPRWGMEKTDNNMCYYWSFNRGHEKKIEVEGVGRVDLPSGLSFGTVGKIKNPGGYNVSVKRGDEILDKIKTKSINYSNGEAEDMSYFYIDISR